MMVKYQLHRQVPSKLFFSQLRYLETLVYTPGYPGLPQPIPQETIPERF